MKMSDFVDFPSREALAQSLALHVADCLRKAIELRGKASLVVSGGSTPVLFFKILKQQALDWQCVTITLADERWVMTSSQDSTEKLVREHLLPAEAQFISMAPQHENDTLAQGADRIRQALGAQISMPFDVVVLGMGEDGHTASLFPNHPALHDNITALCVAVEDSPKPPAQRVSLTGEALRNARQLIIHITGEDKRDVWQQARKTDSLPISRFMDSATTYWAA